MNYLQFILITALTAFLLINRLILPVQAKTDNIGTSLEVSATIGTAMKLFGYTSPFASVTASGISLQETVQANNQGYFEFTGLYVLPAVKELCLTAIDRQKRVANPVCLPIPVPLETTSIGPVILPPSLSLAKGSFLVSQTVAASGESIPNSEINISLFRQLPKLPLFSFRLIPPVEAASLPLYTIKTDQNGYFSFNLPASAGNTFRLFAQVTYDKLPSFKSNTLTFKVLSLLGYLLENFWFLFIFLAVLIASVIIFTRRRNRKHFLMIIKNDNC